MKLILNKFKFYYPGVNHKGFALVYMCCKFWADVNSELVIDSLLNIQNYKNAHNLASKLATLLHIPTSSLSVPESNKVLIKFPKSRFSMNAHICFPVKSEGTAATVCTQMG